MDIVESLIILLRCMQFSALSQWRIERKTGKRYLSRLLESYAICTLIVSLAILLFGIFNDKDFFRKSENDVGQTVDYIQLIGIRVAHIVTIVEAFLRRHGQNSFIRQVREMDRIFECSLNVDVDNRSFRKKIFRRGIVMILIYAGTGALKLLTHFFTNDKNFSIYWVFYLLPLCICGVRYFQIFSAIMIVSHRLDKLVTAMNELNLLHSKPKADSTDSSIINVKSISQALSVYETSEYLKHKYDMENPDMKRLLIIRDLYNRLWELTATINSDFGISILTNVGNDFISITSNCYWIFLNFKSYAATLENFLQIASSFIWSMPHLFNVLMLALLCERTVQRTTAIALGLHRIETNISNDNHNTVIEQFSLQLLHQKLAFSAAGFFDINCSLLYTIAGATTTYLIILIQFHMSEDKLTGN
ncbi:putative gustatory receptor 2a [Zeugodacus cucurbitae]|uniref:putative gustatory receptor 2a n=1 Tax=Zeugodacus cucurbitae TaxID=28588 RepID=UPI0023D9008F|nr:putative gustatory receptor 2a [Zeugodacus cucurbitae]